jgi:hypothetical protein
MNQARGRRMSGSDSVKTASHAALRGCVLKIEAVASQTATPLIVRSASVIISQTALLPRGQIADADATLLSQIPRPRAAFGSLSSTLLRIHGMRAPPLS